MKFLVLCVALVASTVVGEDFPGSYNTLWQMEGPKFDEDNNDIFPPPWRATICYGELGCFDRSIAERLPSEPKSVEPTYMLNANNKSQVKLSWNMTTEALANATEGHFTKKSTLIFVAHGFGETAAKEWVGNLTRASLGVYPDASVIVIDWGKACGLPLYDRASANVPLIANMTVSLTKKLMAVHETIETKNIYFIGFSLGAQMAGYYARSMYNQTQTKIGRIAALDSAAPYFERIDTVPKRGDADFVEALHTSAGDSILTGKVGFVWPYADIDFYPNGGINQPGCSFFRVACAHQRAFSYYIHALEDQTCRMKGIRCATEKEANKQKCSGAPVDFYVGQVDTSNFTRTDSDYHIVYFKTDSKAPFCIREK